MKDLLEAAFEGARLAINVTAQNSPGTFLVVFLVVLVYFKGLPTTAWRKIVQRQNGTSTLHGNMDTIRGSQEAIRRNLRVLNKRMKVIQGNCEAHRDRTAQLEGRVEALQGKDAEKGGREG